MKFVFRLDFGPKIGWGHLSRSLAMASAMVARGDEVVFITKSRTEGNQQLEKFIDSNAIEVHSITSSKLQKSTPRDPCFDSDDQVSDAIETVKISSRAKADIVVLDSYTLGYSWIEIVRASFPVCLISDFPAETEVDYLVDYGFDASSQKHSKVQGSGTKLILGSAFAPIADSYSRYMNSPSGDDNEINRVLISLGGFGEEAMARKILHEIYRVTPGAEVHIAGNPSNYTALQRENPRQILSISQEAGLASQFALSGAAIVGAGVTMYELVASGSTGLVIQTARNQELALSSALATGKVRGLQKVSSTALREKVAAELHPESRVRELEWLKARSLVDHLGPTRLALKLAGRLPTQMKLREVQVSDLPFLLRLANQVTSIAASPNSKTIEPSQHWDWSRGFFDGQRLGWIYGTSALPLGHCRLEREGSHLYLSYSIQEEFQGEGLGTAMLKALFANYSTGEKVFAKVKVQNIASLKALSKVGFVSFQGDGELVTLVREV